MHIYSKDQQAFHLKRSHLELWWNRINVAVVLVQFACFLAAVIRTASSAPKSMNNTFFLNSVLSLKQQYLVDTCVFNVTRNHAFFTNVKYEMSRANVGYFVSRGALNIRYVIAITAVHILLSATNRLWFDTNIHEIRYHYVIFRKDMVMMWEVLVMVLGFVLTLNITEENRIMSDYVSFCSPDRNLSEGYNTVLPFVELSVSYIISLVAIVLNSLISAWHLSEKNPRDAMLREATLREEEWRKAVQQYHEMSNPNRAIGAAPIAAQSEERVGNIDAHTVYAEDRTAAANPNASITSARPVSSSQPARGGEVSLPQSRRGDPHSSNPNRLGRSIPLNSSSMRRPLHPEDSRSQGDLAPASHPSLSMSEQQMFFLSESPNFGPSVSRPLTPLPNADDDQEEISEMAPHEASGEVAGDQYKSPVAMGGPGAAVGYFNSGRYDLYEVGDDEEDERGATVVLDVARSSPQGTRDSFGPAGPTGGDAARGATASDSSTALAAARLATEPPPPPVYGIDSQLRMQSARGKMLAPPSPLQGGAENTDDTEQLL